MDMTHSDASATQGLTRYVVSSWGPLLMTPTTKIAILTQMFNKKGLPEVELCIIYVLFHHALW